MKLAELLIATCCSIIAARSQAADAEREALLKRASEQLERLAPYRRTAGERESELTNLLEIWRSSNDRNDLDDGDRSSPWEVIEVLPDETDRSEGTTAKRIDGDGVDDDDGDETRRVAFGVVADPKYDATMQERIKRGYDGGSAGLITGIAGGVVSGIASASSASAAKASAGSSGGPSYYSKPAYGPSHAVYAYEKPFGPWDFKTAIFGTLIQALKAIGGGVLALKGQIVKGSGFLLAAKSKVLGKTGDVITSFGKQLASSAVLKPYPAPIPDGYTYEQHPVHHIEPDPDYHGSPPHSDDYSEYPPPSSYGVPAGDSDQGGLLIVTPTRNGDPDAQGDQSANGTPEGPDPAKLEESFGGPTKGSLIGNLLSSVPTASVPQASAGTSADHQAAGQGSGGNSNANPYPPLQHPNPTYGTPNHQYAQPNQGNQAQSGYQQQQQQQPQQQQHQDSSQLPLPFPPDYPLYPPYPPLHPVQPLHPYPATPLIGGLSSPLLNGHGHKLPHGDDDGSSVYASISVETEPHPAPVKIPLLGYPGGSYFGLPKPHAAAFHGRPLFPGDLNGPLKLQLLNSPNYYNWHGQSPLAPAFALGTLTPFRKRHTLTQRRKSADRPPATRQSPSAPLRQPKTE